MKDLYEIWGSGKGAVRRLSPRTRISCMLLLISAAVFMPSDSPAGISCAVIIIMTWNNLCGVSAAINKKLFRWTLTMAVFFLFMTPFTGFHASWQVVFHSSAVLFTSVPGMASLSVSEFYHGMHSLHLPGPIAALIVQIVHQSMFLGRETAKTIMAVRLRSAGLKGRHRLAILFSMPVFWLLRLLEKAHSLSMAMTIRKFSI